MIISARFSEDDIVEILENYFSKRGIERSWLCLRSVWFKKRFELSESTKTNWLSKRFGYPVSPIRTSWKVGFWLEKPRGDNLSLEFEIIEETSSMIVETTRKWKTTFKSKTKKLRLPSLEETGSQIDTKFDSDEVLFKVGEYCKERSPRKEFEFANIEFSRYDGQKPPIVDDWGVHVRSREIGETEYSVYSDLINVFENTGEVEPLMHL